MVLTVASMQVGSEGSSRAKANGAQIRSRIAATYAVADPLRTRFVIGLERPVDFQVKALPNPNRVVVELPAIRISLPEQSEERLTGLVD